MSARRDSIFVCECETRRDRESKIKNFHDYFILKIIKFISIIGKEMRSYWVLCQQYVKFFWNKIKIISSIILKIEFIFFNLKTTIN
jgi:hypothetical protein